MKFQSVAGTQTALFLKFSLVRTLVFARNLAAARYLVRLFLFATLLLRERACAKFSKSSLLRAEICAGTSLTEQNKAHGELSWFLRFSADIAREFCCDSLAKACYRIFTQNFYTKAKFMNGLSFAPRGRLRIAI